MATTVPTADMTADGASPHAGGLLRPLALPLTFVLWVVFGTYTLFRPSAGESLAISPSIGHVVVFFFVSLAGFGVLLRWRRPAVALLAGLIGVLVVAAVSEVLQPILTATRQAQRADLAANALGIVGAVGVTGGLLALLRNRRWREATTVLICLVGLAGSAGAIALGPDRFALLQDCRSGGLEALTGADGEPVLLVDGGQVQIGGDSAAQPLGDGLISDRSDGLRCSVLASGGYTIVATVVPESIAVGGPMRIFTSSKSTSLSEYNTHIGQDFDELSIRIRSGDDAQWESVPGVFVAGEPMTVAVVVDLDTRTATAIVDGEVRAQFDLVGGSFAEWDASYSMLIGDELTRDRTYDGDIERVAVFDRALDPAADRALFQP